MRLLIDSNRFIDFCSGDPEVVSRLESAVQVIVPFVVLAEIRVGSLLFKRGLDQARVLTEFLQQPGVRTVHSTDTTTHHCASLYVYLRKQGTPIPTNDIWIAALALEHSLVVYTRDSHFDHLPQIPKIR